MDKFSEVLQNYDDIKAEVAKLSSDSATLVLASKTVSRDILIRLSTARPGVIYGENKVQELLEKYYSAPEVTWQFIGRLQTNKVKYIVDKVSMIQSVDSDRLAQEIEKRCAKIDKVMDVLVEVNIGSEESKGGVTVQGLDDLLECIKDCPHLRLKGIMSVLPNASEDELIPLYGELKKVFEQAKKVSSPNFEVSCLSAGMSGDYKTALKCGSTMVRIGSAVFGARVYAK